MRLWVAQQMRDRLLAAGTDGGRLAQWAEDYGQAVPRVVVGYRQPQAAQDWPFVALLPLADVQDLLQGYRSALTMGLVCGVRSAEQDRAGSGAQVALDVLADLAIQILADPVSYTAGAAVLVAERAELTAVDLAHPHYQAEQQIHMTSDRGL